MKKWCLHEKLSTSEMIVMPTKEQVKYVSLIGSPVNQGLSIHNDL